MIATFSVALTSCATQTTPLSIQVSSSTPAARTASNSSSLSTNIFNGVNNYRSGKAINNMQRHAGLDKLALAHCKYLLKHRGEFNLYGKNVSHYGSEGRATMAKEVYSMSSVSENVGFLQPGFSDPAGGLIKMWSRSAGHEYGMAATWTHTGVGSVTDRDGAVFATQIFANLGNSQSMMRQRFNGF